MNHGKLYLLLTKKRTESGHLESLPSTKILPNLPSQQIHHTPKPINLTTTFKGVTRLEAHNLTISIGYRLKVQELSQTKPPSSYRHLHTLGYTYPVTKDQWMMLRWQAVPSQKWWWNPKP